MKEIEFSKAFIVRDRDGHPVEIAAQ